MEDWKKERLNKSKQWYLSLSTCDIFIRCWDATKVEITKHHGCIEYRGNGRTLRYSVILDRVDCYRYFNHYPKKEELIYVKKPARGTWKMQTIKLAFTD